VPREAESGLIACAAMAATATGRFSSVHAAVDAFVRYEPEIRPDPGWAEKYARMQPIFDRLYRQSQSLYDALDALSR
jgi:xylulokinase